MRNTQSNATEGQKNGRKRLFIGVRRENLPYLLLWVFYYAWVIVFTTWWTASPFTLNVFGTGMRSMLHSLNLVSSAVFVLIMKKDDYLRYTRIGAVAILVSMAVYFTTTNALVSLIAAVCIGVSLGCVNIGILMPFVFTLDNEEKLYAVVGSNMLIGILSFFPQSNVGGGAAQALNMVISLVILLMALSAIFFFKEDAVPAQSEKQEKSPHYTYFILIINCVFAVLCKGIGKGLLNGTAEAVSLPVMQWYILSGIMGSLIYFLVHRFSRKSIYLAWNIAFACIAMGLYFNVLIPKHPAWALGFAALLGIGSTVGMINMYYTLGMIARQLNSMRYVRLSIVFIGVCGGMGGVLFGNLIDNVGASEASMTASVFAAAVMLLFLMLSPVFSLNYYGEKTAIEERMETRNGHPMAELFAQYRLSQREIDVCRLLLGGYTLRQISAMLSIAYGTVNTYCTSLYRKFNINSRTQLLLMFRDCYDETQKIEPAKSADEVKQT